MRVWSTAGGRRVRLAFVAEHRAGMRMPARPAAAGHQSGVFTRAQARAGGWSAYQVRRRVGDGTWTALPGRGLVVAGTTLDPITLAWATHLSAPGAVLSHLTAGAVHGFPLPGATTVGYARTGLVGEVIAPDRNRIRGVHRHVLALGPDECCRIGRLPVTTLRRTAVDCLGVLDRRAAVQLWAWLASRAVLTRSQLAEDVRTRFGRSGTPNLLHVLALASTGAASAAELALHRLLRSAGITGWRANARVLDRTGRIIARVDVLFGRERVVIEVDGFAAHSGREAFVQDRRRQNALVNAGYRVLRLTWADLTDSPRQAIAAIRQALALEVSVTSHHRAVPLHRTTTWR